MEGLQGIAVLKQLKEICPQQQVIIYTGHASRESAIDALNFGAFRYLLKPVALEDLKTTLTEAVAKARRESLIDQTLPITATIMEESGLSKRETEIALALVEGKTNPEIAQQFCVSIRTVEKHIEHIFAHLGIRSRSKLSEALRDRKSQQDSDSDSALS